MSEGIGLLLAREEIAARRDAARAPLAPLATSLAADLERVRTRELFIPPEKARMTRVGGRCAEDGALLAFDPFAPRVHACPVCGRTYDGEEHYRWWIFWYQLWLAERAVHGATLALLANHVEAGAFARRVVTEYAERYLSYPNRDNVLGPTRLFFSTYLESIWLLQICVATDLLELGGELSLGASVRDRIVEPSRALIASYDERTSNRQVWNAAALAAASRLLGDAGQLARAIDGPSGVLSHMRTGLLADGTWYEGENYHQFAHRGLWYGVTIAELAGVVVPDQLRARFERGFVAPFLTALPDLTLPARRDSQWAISLRQWRWAESCELGLARRDDAELAGALSAIYSADDTLPRRDTGRWRSAAESERNEPPSVLTRADLGWRSLLRARAEPARPNAWAPPSVLLPAQGIAVFRRDGGTRWTALDYGASGGGHGHPDRLNVLLADRARRWLDDMGTGSYVERALHWYRSTLAHNAPLADGRSQARRDGVLEGYDERGDWGWAVASALIADGVRARRSLVVGPHYVVDRVQWSAPPDTTIDVPFHFDAEWPDALEWRGADADGAGGLEDGFDFLSEVRASDLSARRIVSLRAPASRAIYASDETSPPDGPACRAWIAADVDATWMRATAPSSPGRAPRRFQFLRACAARGEVVSVWDTRGAVHDVAIEPGRVVVQRADATDEHEVRDLYWRVVEAGREITLRTSDEAPNADDDTRVAFVEMTSGSPLHHPWVFRLGEKSYRRSELNWEEAGRPSADVALELDDDRLRVDVHVTTPHPTFVRAGTANALDNERAEINGHGVQLYVRAHPELGRPSEARAWLLVPEEGSDQVRRIALTPASEAPAPAARWRRTERGYAMEAAVPRSLLGEPGDTFDFDLIINETTPERERRRGQLVLSGARGEWVYLQGDRQDPERFLRFRLPR